MGSWARGRFGELTRTVVSGPDYLVDVLELDAAADRVLELPWHLAGELVTVDGAGPGGTWQPATLDDRFISNARAAGAKRRAARAAPPRRRLAARDPPQLRRRAAPRQRPRRAGHGGRQMFYLQRAAGPRRAARRRARCVSRGQRCPGGARQRQRDRSRYASAGPIGTTGRLEGWNIDGPAARIRLAGRRTTRPPLTLLPTRLEPPLGGAPSAREVPALDGTLDGFDDAAPLASTTKISIAGASCPMPGPRNSPPRALGQLG